MWGAAGEERQLEKEHQGKEPDARYVALVPIYILSPSLSLICPDACTHAHTHHGLAWEVAFKPIADLSLLKP